MSTDVTYSLIDVSTGKPVSGFGDDYSVLSSLRPQVGEYLNQSGIYFKVVTVLQHFDSDRVEVFVAHVGDSQDFLTQIQK